MKVLLVVGLLWACVLASPSSITLNTIIRDFTPDHPDFEHYLGDDRGFVSLTEDADGKPSFRAGASPNTVTSLQSFQQWYRDTTGVNIRFNSQITLTPISSTIYSFNDPSYFPIDNQGFGNYESYGHNFHFTTEIHTSFTYEGGEEFTFIGDDDVFVYIDNKLAIDLGGVHPTESASVNLDTLGLTVGTTYTLDVFQAERHTVASTFRMDTSLQLTSTNPDDGHVGRSVYFCGVKFEGYCAGIPANQCPSDPNFNHFGDSKRLLSAATSFANFNVISFGNFQATTGDVQGRIAVAGDLVVSDGFSVGSLVNNQGAAATDLVSPFSVVVGGNAVIGTGRIMPDSLTSPDGFSSVPEGVFVGGTLTAPSYIQEQVTGSCGTSAGCLSSDFSNAQSYYNQISTQIAATPANTQTLVDESHALNIVCSDQSAAVNYINLNTNTFNSLLSYNTPTNCGPQSSYVFTIQPNVDGSSGVTVQGDGQHFTDPSNVIYNFPSSDASSGNKRVAQTLRSISTPNGGLMGHTLAPHGDLDAGTGVNTGLTVAGNIRNSKQFNKPSCPLPIPSVPTNPDDGHLCPYFESDCSGLQFPLGNAIGSFRDFNVISFGDFNANTGDVEGRLAVQHNLNLGAGYSVGAELQTANGKDAELPYSVVVGGDAVFLSGAVFPEGNGIPYPGAEEDLFVGGTFVGESDLSERVLGSCHGVAGCLDATFDAAHECYSNFQASLASEANNVGVNVQWSALELTCTDNTASHYTVTITASQFNAATYYVVDNCNLQATWVVNVPGSDNVTFAGDTFPAISGGAVFNVLGSGRYIIVQTEVNGNLLAPDNILYQSGGKIDGKVVVGDVAFALQINKPHCPNPAAVILNGVAEPSNKGSVQLGLQAGQNAFVLGDSITVGSETHTVTSVDSNGVTLDSGLNNAVAQGTRVWTIVQDPSKARISQQNDSQSSAASVQVATLALLVIALLASLF